MHHFHELRCDCETQPGASEFSCCRPIRLSKWRKDKTVLVHRNSNPGIANGKMQEHLVGGLKVGSHLEHNLTAFGELDCVAHKVDHDLAQAAGIANQRVTH